MPFNPPSLIEQRMRKSQRELNTKIQELNLAWQNHQKNEADYQDAIKRNECARSIDLA